MHLQLGRRDLNKNVIYINFKLDFKIEKFLEDSINRCSNLGGNICNII